jgi:hypothetical protein
MTKTKKQSDSNAKKDTGVTKKTIIKTKQTKQNEKQTKQNEKQTKQNEKQTKQNEKQTKQMQKPTIEQTEYAYAQIQIHASLGRWEIEEEKKLEAKLGRALKTSEKKDIREMAFHIEKIVDSRGEDENVKTVKWKNFSHKHNTDFNENLKGK